MEHHWSNLNLNQAYGRLQTPPNAASLNRFDLHLLEQQGFATAGLGAAAGLSSPLPAHATLSPAARTFTTGLPHVSYSALPMAPLFDSVAHLTQGFAAASQSPYRAAMQSVTAQPMYTINAAGHPVSSAARFASIVAASAVVTDAQPPKPVSLFNTDPHTMGDPVASALGGIAAAQSSSAAQQVGWGRTSVHAAPANPYAGIPTEFAGGGSSLNRYAPKVTGVTAGEPPPAHSGSRPNTAARTPSYQTKEYTMPSPQHRLPTQQPSVNNQPVREAPRFAIYTPVEQQRLAEPNPPTAHSNLLPRTGDDLMQKLLQTYGSQRSVDRPVVPATVARVVCTGYASSPPVTAAQSTVVGRPTPQNYNDPTRIQRPYTNYGITTSLMYAVPVYGQSSGDEVMEELSYDDVSSPEGIGLQEVVAAATLAGVYQNVGTNVTVSKPSAVGGHEVGILTQESVRHVVPAAMQRPPSAALGRPAAPDPTIQAQADSTTRPKKGGGGRGVRAAPGDAGSERGGKRSRGGSNARSKAKGRAEEEAGIASVAPLRTAELSMPDLNNYSAPSYAQLLPADFGGTGQGYVTAEAFTHAYPYQVTTAECMLAATSRPDVTHRLAVANADGTIRSDAAVQHQEAQVFMTNMFGSAFVNPNELLTVDQIAFVDPTDGTGYTVQAIPKPETKQHTVIDEEFGHLAADPTSGTEQAHIANNTPTASSSATGGQELPKQPAESKSSAGFLNSFLSFVQGKKPETLASVSTTVITKKPVLPKYIPEPPRPKPPRPPTPPPVAVSSSPPSDAALRARTRTTPEKQKEPIVVHFSDDDDDDEDDMPLSKRPGGNIRQTVSKVISSLGDYVSLAKKISPNTAMTKAARRGRPSKKSTAPPAELPSLPQKAAKVPVVPKQKPKKIGRSKSSKKGAVDRINLSDDDGDVMVVESAPTQLRERSVRKAKEKAAELQRKPLSIHRARAKGPGRFDDDSEMSPDDVEPDSDNAEDTEKGYDSDKDPVWRPHPVAQPPAKRISVTLSSDSEDDGESQSCKGKGKGRSRGGKRPALSPVKTQSVKPAMQTSTVIVRSDKAKDAMSVTTPPSARSDNIWQSVDEAGDTKLEQRVHKPVISSELHESFRVYIQVLISQALEPSFFSVLIQRSDPYYIRPLNEIDSEVMKRKNSLRSVCHWKPELLTIVEKYSSCDVESVAIDAMSEVDHNERASKRINFFGCVYTADKLEVTAKLDKDAAMVFFVSDRESEILKVYHTVHHAKFHLFQECTAKVTLLRSKSAALPNDQVLDQCLRDQSWMTQVLTRLHSQLAAADKFCIR